MKSFLSLLFLLFSINVFADKLYSVSGVSESSGTVQGEVFSNTPYEDNEVYGQLTDEHGDVHSFTGKWIGNGQISGETDDGESVELLTK